MGRKQWIKLKESEEFKLAPPCTPFPSSAKKKEKSYENHLVFSLNYDFEWAGTIFLFPVTESRQEYEGTEIVQAQWKR